MTEAEHRAAILAAPNDDDGPRSVYADWLVERGDPRGELLQLSLEIPRLAGDERAAAVRGRAELVLAHYEWIPFGGHRFARGFIDAFDFASHAIVTPGAGLNLARSVSVPSLAHLEVLLGSPVADSVEELIFTGTRSDRIAALAERRPPRLVLLGLEYPTRDALDEVISLRAKLRLRRLRIESVDEIPIELVRDLERLELGPSVNVDRGAPLLSAVSATCELRIADPTLAARAGRPVRAWEPRAPLPWLAFDGDEPADAKILAEVVARNLPAPRFSPQPIGNPMPPIRLTNPMPPFTQPEELQPRRVIMPVNVEVGPGAERRLWLVGLALVLMVVGVIVAILLVRQVTEPELRAEIAARPDDDDPRRIYADWLIDRGDLRGELIQLDLSIGALTGAEVVRAAIRRQELAEAHPQWAPVENPRYVRGFAEEMDAPLISGMRQILDGPLVLARRLTLGGDSVRALEVLLARSEMATVESIELDLGSSSDPDRMLEILGDRPPPRLRRLVLPGAPGSTEALARLAARPCWSRLERIGIGTRAPLPPELFRGIAAVELHMNIDVPSAVEAVRRAGPSLLELRAHDAELLAVRKDLTGGFFVATARPRGLSFAAHDRPRRIRPEDLMPTMNPAVPFPRPTMPTNPMRPFPEMKGAPGTRWRLRALLGILFLATLALAIWRWRS